MASRVEIFVHLALAFSFIPPSSGLTCNMFYGTALTKGELSIRNLTSCNSTINQWPPELAAGRECAVASSACIIRAPACYWQETCNGTSCYQDITKQSGVWEAYGMCDTYGGINSFGKTTYMTSKTSFTMTNGDVMRCTTDDCNTWLIGGYPNSARRLTSPSILSAAVIILAMLALLGT